jgi:hypothetical protein
MNIAHKEKLTSTWLRDYLVWLPNKYSPIMSSCFKEYNNKGYIAMLPPATLTHRLQALHRQRPSGTPSGATSSRTRRLWLCRHATTSYVDTPPLGTPSAMTLGYSLRGYLEPVMPSPSTSTRRLRLHRQQWPLEYSFHDKQGENTKVTIQAY